MQITKQADLKLGVANECPGAEVVEEMLNEEFGKEWNTVDTDDKYWQNDYATLIFSFPGGLRAIAEQNAKRLGQILGADEWDVKIAYDKKEMPVYVARLWWD